MKIRFVKHFTSGLLSGLSVRQELSFVNEARAAKWLDGVLANERAGKLNFRLELCG